MSTIPEEAVTATSVIQSALDQLKASPPVIHQQKKNKGGRPKGSTKKRHNLDRVAAPAPTTTAEPAKGPSAASKMSATALERYRRSVQSGGFNRRLPHRPMDGFNLRFVNDEAGRIQQFIEIGYDFVTNEEQGINGASTDPGDKYSVVVGTNAAGHEMRAYLLKIPEEWYAQLKAVEREQVSRVEKAIKLGKLDAKPSENRYVPKVGIKIQDH